MQPRARRDLNKLAKSDRLVIFDKLHELATDPYSSGSVKKLQGSEYYRLRVGKFRVVYEIQNSVLIILVLAVGHRKEIYRR